VIKTNLPSILHSCIPERDERTDRRTDGTPVAITALCNADAL